MAVTKTIVCLANSRKLSGRCLAGKEFTGATFGAWVRPVSSRPTEEVSERERQYRNGADPRVLDILDVPLLEPRPKNFQSENWLLNPRSYWVYKGKASTSDLHKGVDTPGSLWLNGYNTYNGLNDHIPIAEAEKLTSSLYLIGVKSLTLNVFAPGANFGNHKRRVQARFEYGSVQYWIWVTDPVIERDFLAKEDGTHDQGPRLITVSLGEPHNGYCYKLLAAVI